jgi:hypothetical protein
MTTFTTEDRILAEKDGSLTFNVEPIPFAGLITITETPQLKTLTDGEIVKIFQTTEFWQYSDLVHENDAIEFARAILRKAQEK